METVENIKKKIYLLPSRDFPIIPKKEDYLLHSLVISCGHAKETSQKYYWDGMKRGDKGIVLFQYTISGWGMLEYEDTHYKIDKGKAMLLHIPHNHCYYLPKNSPYWEFVYVCLAGSEIFRIFSYIEKKCIPVVSIRNNSPVFENFLRIHNLASNLDMHSSYKLSYLAYELGMNILMELQPEFQGKTDPAFIEKAKDFCRKNYDKSISVDDIAKAAGYSRFHFSRLFKQTVELSPHEYLEHLRINKACELLLSENLIVKEVSWRCGFTDVNYFCKVFQKITGLTPSAYRKRGY